MYSLMKKKNERFSFLQYDKHLNLAGNDFVHAYQDNSPGDNSPGDDSHLTTPPQYDSPGGRLPRRTTPLEDDSPGGRLPGGRLPRRTTPSR